MPYEEIGRWRIDAYLAPSKCQGCDAQDLCDCDSANDAAGDIDHRRPRPRITASETVSGRALHRGTAGESVGACNVCSEFDADADTYDEIDKGDGVQRNAHDSH